jgi:hypothetical protein
MTIGAQSKDVEMNASEEWMSMTLMVHANLHEGRDYVDVSRSAAQVYSGTRLSSPLLAGITPDAFTNQKAKLRSQVPRLVRGCAIQVHA